MNSQYYQFDGYNEIAYTAIPDEFFDFQMQKLSIAELRVLLYIFRRTFGFKKHQDRISMGQFLDGIEKRSGEKLDDGCGLKTGASVRRGIDGLIKHGYIDAQFYCGSCNRPVEPDEMVDDVRQQTRTDRQTGKQACITYTAKVVPMQCPGCGRTLRGREQRWVCLVMKTKWPSRDQSEDEVCQPETEGYVSCEHTPTSASDVPLCQPETIQDTVYKTQPQDTEDNTHSPPSAEGDNGKTGKEILEEHFGPPQHPASTGEPLKIGHWAERAHDRPWLDWSVGRFRERQGVSVEAQERVAWLVEYWHGLGPTSDGDWKGWGNGCILAYKAGLGDWDAIEAGIREAAAWEHRPTTMKCRLDAQTDGGFVKAIRRAKARADTPSPAAQAVRVYT